MWVDIGKSSTHTQTSPNQPPTTQDGRRLQAAIQAQQPVSTVDVLVVGPEAGADLTDASTREHYEAVLRSFLQPNGGHQAVRRLKALVFMASAHDDSSMGEIGFGRLLRFCQVSMCIG